MKKSLLGLAILLPLVLVVSVIAVHSRKEKPRQFELKVSEKCYKAAEDLSDANNHLSQEGPTAMNMGAVLLISPMPFSYSDSERSYEIKFQKLNYEVELTPGNHVSLTLVPGAGSAMLVNGQTAPLPAEASSVFSSVFTAALAHNGQLMIAITAGAKADSWQKLGLDPFTILSMGFFGAQLEWHPGMTKTFLARMSELPDGVMIPITTSITQNGAVTSSFNGKTNGIQTHLYEGTIPLSTKTSFDVSVNGATILGEKAKEMNQSKLTVEMNSNTETSSKGVLVARMSIKDYKMELDMQPLSK